MIAVEIRRKWASGLSSSCRAPQATWLLKRHQRQKRLAAERAEAAAAASAGATAMEAAIAEARAAHVSDAAHMEALVAEGAGQLADRMGLREAEGQLSEPQLASDTTGDFWGGSLSEHTGSLPALQAAGDSEASGIGPADLSSQGASAAAPRGRPGAAPLLSIPSKSAAGHEPPPCPIVGAPLSERAMGRGGPGGVQLASRGACEQQEQQQQQQQPEAALGENLNVAALGWEAERQRAREQKAADTEQAAPRGELCAALVAWLRASAAAAGTDAPGGAASSCLAASTPMSSSRLTQKC
jgi:hypothetical protein